MLGRVLGQAFIDDDADCSFGDSHSKRIATIGAPVVSRLDHIHDVLVAKDPADWNHSTRNALSHYQNVCSDVFVILCKQFSSAAEACLNLVHDQEDVELCAEITYSFQVASLGYDATCLALDGLDADGTDVWVSSKLCAEGWNIIVFEQFETSGEWAKISIPRWVVAGA